jgi:signal transduction histidine kinase
MDKLSTQSKMCLFLSFVILSFFFLVESFIVFGIFKPSYTVTLVGYVCIIVFTFPFLAFVMEFLDMTNNSEKELMRQVMEKNVYLEHAAKILRHDMHSGINTYLPRGVRSLERRLGEDRIKELKIQAPLRLIKDGLAHSQQVYRGVFEFTNLVRENATLTLEKVSIKESLTQYLKRTAYKDQVKISSELPDAYINEALFCTAIDNLIRNGLKYNDSKTKFVKISMENNKLSIADNGRGLSIEAFKELKKPYTRKTNQKESGSGLGLNICMAILNEHGFEIRLKDVEKGTTFLIDIKDNVISRDSND